MERPRAVRSAMPRLSLMREKLATATNSDAGKKAAPKKARKDALTSIARDLESSSVIAGLNFFTRREIARGQSTIAEEDDGADPEDTGLGWIELLFEIHLLLNETAVAEEKKAKPMLALPLQAAATLGIIVTAIMKEDHTTDTLGLLVPHYVTCLVTWHTKPALVDILPDAWSIYADMIAYPILRATLSSSALRNLSGICFQQISQRGALYRLAPILSSVRKVFVLLATEAPGYVALATRQKKQIGSPAAGYSLIMQHACLLLFLARTMKPPRQRDVEGMALAVLAAASSSHALDLDGAVAVCMLRERGAPAAAACWPERAHRASALAFVSVLVRLVDVTEGVSKDIDLLRERVEEDLKAFEVGGRGGRGVRESPEEELLDIASVFLGVDVILERLRNVQSAVAATLWLRVLHARLVRRENLAIFSTLSVATAVVSVFRKVGGDSRALPATCAFWACRVTRVAAEIATCLPSASIGGIGRVGGKGLFGGVGFGAVPFSALSVSNSEGRGQLVPAASSVEEILESDDGGEREDETESDAPSGESSRFVWLSVYQCLLRQILRGRMSTVGRRPSGGARGRGDLFVRAESAVISLATYLVSVGAVTGVDVSSVLAAGGGGESVWSLSLFDVTVPASSSTDTLFDFARTHISVAGFDVEDGGVLKGKLVRKLLTVCDPVSTREAKLPGITVVNAASAVLGLVRGSCRQFCMLPGYESIAEDRRLALDFVEDLRPRCVKLLDAVRAVFCFSDEVDGEGAVLQSTFFRDVKSDLETCIFPAGGGWNERFFVGDRVNIRSTEDSLRSSARPARMAVDKGLQRRLEGEIVGILARCCLSAERSVSTGGKKNVPRTSQKDPRNTGKGNSGVGDDGDGDSFPGTIDEEGEDEDSLEADGFDSFLNSNLLNEDAPAQTNNGPQTAPLTSGQSVEVYLRVVSFLGEYLAEAISLGLLTMGAEQEEQDGAIDGRDLANFLAVIVEKLTATPFDLFVTKTALEILRHAMLSSLALVQAIRSRDQGGSTGQGRMLRNLGRSLSASVVDVLFKSLLKRLETAINRVAVTCVSDAKLFSSSLASLFRRSKASESSKRQRPSNASPRSKKRSKRSADNHLSDQSESDGRSFADSDDDFMSDVLANDFDEENVLGDASFLGTERQSQRGTQRTQEANSAHDTLCEEEIVSLLCRCLLPVFSLAPDAADIGVKQLLDCLENVWRIERSIESDGKRSGIVAGEFVCPFYLNMRCTIWDLLLAVGSGSAVEGAAQDMIKTGRKWESIVNGIADVSANVSEIFSSKSRPVFSTYVENFRSRLLLYFSRFFEFYIGVGARPRILPDPENPQRVLVRNILRCADELQNFGGSRARVPRETKIVLLRFTSAAIELIDGPLSKTSKGETKFPGHGSHCSRLRAFLELALSNSDPSLRLAAAGVGPILIRVQSFSQGAETPDVQRDPDFPALAIPFQESCIDSSKAPFTCVSESAVGNADNGEEFDDDSDIETGVMGEEKLHGFGHESSWLLSDSCKQEAEKNYDAFVQIGANCMGNSSMLALSEAGARCSPEMESAIYCLLVRASSEKIRGSQSMAFGALVRLAGRVGYRDPAGMFRAHRRDILSRWINTPKEFVDLPACLLLSGNRFRDGGIHDLLFDNSEEIVPLVLASDLSSSTELEKTSEFARLIDVELPELLLENVVGCHRLCLVHTEAGSKLFCQITAAAPELQSSKLHGAEVLCGMLLSISCGSVSRVTRENYNVDLHDVEFRRDCSLVGPPQFDPLVCLLGMDHYVSPTQIQTPVSPENIGGLSMFSAKCIKSMNWQNLHRKLVSHPSFALQMLNGIMQQLKGPPGPSSAQSRGNAFMALGALYLVAEDILLNETVLRLAFFDLIVIGFRHRETAKNAKWLVLDVCKKFVKGKDKTDKRKPISKFVPSWDSACVGCMRLPEGHFLRDLLLFDSFEEQRWLELLELFTPSLISIGASISEDPLVEMARRVVRELFSAAREIDVTAVLDALPDGNVFKAERRQQEQAFKRLVKTQLYSPDRLLEYHLWRFTCRRKDATLETSGFVAPIKSLREALEKNRSTLETALHFETRLDSVELFSSNFVYEFACHALQSLVSIVEHCRLHDQSYGKMSAGIIQLDFMDQNLVRTRRCCHERDEFAVVEEEALRCIGVLGMAWPSSLPVEVGSDHPKSFRVELESTKNSVLSPGDCLAVRVAGSLLVGEIRSENSVARQAACVSLLRFFQTPSGKEIYRQLSQDCDGELAIFKTKKLLGKMHSPKLLDPVSGSKVEGIHLDIRKACIWNPCRGGESFSSHEVPSAWIRTLSATLATECDIDALNVLVASCYASSAFASSMFPHLLCNFVRCNEMKPRVIPEISGLILSEILENPKAPVGALRLVVSGLDALCEIGIARVRSDGVGQTFFTSSSGRKEGLPERSLESYVLSIPYLVAARAANRCGAYYSALRFASLHVDAACIQAEFRWIVKGDRSPSLAVYLVKAKDDARLAVGDVISVALKHVSEQDGQRAVLERGGVTAQSAVVASVESNWPRLLGNCDVLQGLSVASEGDSGRAVGRGSRLISPLQESAQLFSLVRERHIVRSMIGLGSLKGVVKYWHGLRHETVGFDLGAGDAHSANQRGSGLPSIEEEVQAASDLFELRCEAAWKLGQWQTPTALSVGYLSSREQTTAPAAGLHEFLHSGLRSLSSGDISGALASVVSAKEAIANRLTYGLSGSVMASVREAAQSLLLVEDMYLAVPVLAGGQDDSRSSAFRASLRPSSAGSALEVTGFVDGSDISTAELRFNELKSTLGVEALYLKVPTEVPVFKDDGRDKEMALTVSNPAFARFSELSGIWRQRDSSTIYSQPRSLVSASYTETALSLRLALARSLNVKPYITRLCGELATSILDGGSGTGSWSRAASALGSVESSRAFCAPSYEAGTWKLAEARLFWEASEEGRTKIQALRDVTGLIFNQLGGKKTSRSNAGLGFNLFWDKIDCLECNSESLALLRVEACRLAALWSSEMRVEEPMALFNGFLKMGASAFPSSVTVSEGKCCAFYTMAQFADRQLKSNESYRKTDEYAYKVQNVEKMEENIKRAEEMLRNLAKNQIAKRNSLRRYLKDLTVNFKRDSAVVESVSTSIRDWEFQAAQHYAKCLGSGSSHDLRAAFRLVYIWLESGSLYPSINGILVSRVRGESLTCEVPTNKLLPLVPQIVSRLGSTGNAEFQQALDSVITGMSLRHPSHCLWLLISVSNLMKSAPAGSKGHELLVAGNETKAKKAMSILEAVQSDDKEVVNQTRTLTKYYFKVAEIPKPGEKVMSITLSIPSVENLDRVVVPTLPLPLHGYSVGSGDLPTVFRFEKKAKILGGLSRPKLLQCCGSDGVSRSQVVKSDDDMRQDAVMEQLFGVLNELLNADEASSTRNLMIRTYRVVPLSPHAGFMQFVCNTENLREYLVGKPHDDPSEKRAAHCRHRPHDTRSSVISKAAWDLHQKGSTDEAPRMNLMKKYWKEIHPVFRYYFLENFADPSEWHARQLAYTRSTAVMSIVGWVLGIGDRHLSNILIDSKTGELVHIDFGIAFESGKLLRTPEKMPFRLTRDVEDGMGIDGVEGVFRKSCEVTMQLLRENKDLVSMVVDVLIHDPLYNWSQAPLKALQAGSSKRRASSTAKEVIALDSDDSESGGPSFGARETVRRDGNEKAIYVLSVISEKLEGLEGSDRLSVEAHVARLIDSARSFDVQASAWLGWTPWL